MKIVVSVNVSPNYISLLIVTSLFCNLNRLSVAFVFNIDEHCLQEYLKMSRISNALKDYTSL